MKQTSPSKRESFFARKPTARGLDCLWEQYLIMIRLCKELLRSLILSARNNPDTNDETGMTMMTTMIT